MQNNSVDINLQKLYNSSIVSEIKLYYCNARSIKNKLSDLHGLLYMSDYNVIALSETWLLPQLTDAIIDPRGLYTVYRKDRERKVGGGVCLLALMCFILHMFI